MAERGRKERETEIMSKRGKREGRGAISGLGTRGKRGDGREEGEDLRRENIRWFLLSFPFFEEVFFLSLPRSTTTVCRYLDIP